MEINFLKRYLAGNVNPNHNHPGDPGKENVGKKGVVRDKNVHQEVIELVINYARSIGFQVCNLDFSPIKGPEGNIEYLLHLMNNDIETSELSVNDISESKILEVVNAAHENLD